MTVKSGAHTQVQLNDGKSGYLAQSSLPLYFGLGDASSAESVKVRWPSGKEQVVRGPFKPGAVLRITEP